MQNFWMLLLAAACTFSSGSLYGPPPAGLGAGGVSLEIPLVWTMYEDNPNRMEFSIPKIPILLYHSIRESPENSLMVTPERFDEEMIHLRNAGYYPLLFSDLRGWERGRPLPKKPILITLDDGYEDNYTNAFPILWKTNMRATIFAVTDNMGKPGRLTWDEMKEMERSRLIDIQSHSRTHPNLTQLTPEQKKNEIMGSRQVIRKYLGKEAIAFSYPYGFYDQSIVDEVRQAGYSFAVTTEPGPAELSQGALTLHRVFIPGEMPIEDFKKMFP